MNYLKIHNYIISNAKSRIYDDTIHQLHHIEPKHENPNSIETVPLTLKEHYIIHYLRYKIGFGIGNKLAYHLMRNISVKYSLKELKELASLAGKKGGKITKQNMSGIFSKDYSRSAETKRRHFEKILIPPLKGNSLLAKLYGKLSVLSKKGIHNPNYDRSNNSKQLWKSGRMDNVREHLKNNAKSGGTKCKQSLKGIHNPEKRKEYAKLGGAVSGKLFHWTDGKTNKKSLISPGHGWRRGRVLKSYKRRNIT